MIKFKEFLCETLSSKLYHSTNANGAYHILKDNQFKLSPVIEGDVEHDLNKGKNYYMSFSRSKGSYFLNGLIDNNKLPVFTFIINGDKLNHQFGGSAINYFNTGEKQNNNEYEDRLMTNKPIIANASQYIESVHCYLSSEYMKNPNAGQTLHQVKNVCESRGIPLYFYNDRKAFTLLDTSKSINLENKFFNKDQSHSEITSGNFDKGGKKDYDSIVSILSKGREDLNGNDQHTLAYLSNPSTRNEIASNILRYLRSIKQSDRETIAQYNEILKNSGAKNINELLEKIANVYGRRKHAA